MRITFDGKWIYLLYWVPSFLFQICFPLLLFVIYWCVRCQDLHFVVTKLRSLDHLDCEVSLCGKIPVFHASNGLLEDLCEPTDEVESFKLNHLPGKDHETKVSSSWEENIRHVVIAVLHLLNIRDNLKLLVVLVFFSEMKAYKGAPFPWPQCCSQTQKWTSFLCPPPFWWIQSCSFPILSNF